MWQIPLSANFVKYFLCCCLYCFFNHALAQAQCTSSISQFPYQEGFEANDGGWIPGGSNSDWEWGSPSKKIITRAAGGTKCWIAGGLTKTQYNGLQASSITSPCFDFSTIANPFFSCKIFWETERQYDGGSLEYSIDGGITWNTLGNSKDKTDCNNANWFNQAATRNVPESWSGTIMPPSSSNCIVGNGAGSWITAKHTISQVAGKNNVRFRFMFKSGNTCNNFDGFAVDDIYIGDIPTPSLTFDYACAANKTMRFAAYARGCVTQYIWNFGDGTVDRTLVESPEYQYANDGTYTVTCKAVYADNSVLSFSKTVSVFSVKIAQVTGLLCSTDTAKGKLLAQITGANPATMQYSWNTGKAKDTLDYLDKLNAGTYIATVKNAVCSISDTFKLTAPTPLITSITVIDTPKCNLPTGQIDANASGGTAPYTYKWNTGSTAQLIANLKADSLYKITVTDANGCTVTAQTILPNINNLIRVQLGSDTTICPGEQLVLSNKGFASYLWNTGSVADTLVVVQTGTYWLKVTDKDGCTAADTITITVDCSDIYFPTAFTPNNGDDKNNYFKPLGNVPAVKNYQLLVYNRFGQLVFQTRDPYFKWDGKVQGSLPDAGTVFVWMASYSLPRKKGIQKTGTLILLR